MLREEQEKRQKFRQEIRKRNLMALFSNYRSNLNELETHVFAPVSSSLKQQLSMLICRFMEEIIASKNHRKYQRIMQDLQEIEMRVAEYPESFSYCLNEELQIHGERVIDSSKKDIPLSVLGDLDEPNVVMEQQQNMEVELRMVSKLMQLSSKLYYHKFSLQAGVLILKILWNVATNRYYIPNEQFPQLTNQILNNFLLSLSKLLLNKNRALFKKHLKQLGLSSHLSLLIDLSKNFNNKTHRNMLTLIERFTSSEKQEQEQGQGAQDQFNGVVIIANQANYYEKYVVYCVYFLKKVRNDDLYPLALMALDNIFNEAGYLIDYIRVELYQCVLELILHPNRQISVLALQLMNTIVFYSEAASDELIEKFNILDTLCERLMIEKQMSNSEMYRKKSVEKCTYIICDLLLTKDRKLKNLMYSHPIWELIYQNIDESSPIFGTVLVFKYFFSSFGKKRILDVLPSVIPAFGNLNLGDSSIPYVGEVRQIIIELYREAQEFWDEENYESLMALYANNGLMKYLEEVQ